MKKTFTLVLLIICFMIGNVYASDNDNIELVSLSNKVSLTGSLFGNETVSYYVTNANSGFVGTWKGTDASDNSSYITISKNTSGNYLLNIYNNEGVYDSIPLTIKEENGYISGTYKKGNVDGTFTYKENDNANILIRMPKTSSYGIVADLSVDSTKLNFVKCFGLNDYNVTSDGNRIVIDSPKTYDNNESEGGYDSVRNAAICIFEKKIIVMVI